MPRRDHHQRSRSATDQLRLSSVDGVEGGLELADQVAFATEAKARGADLIDCSSGGLMGSATAARIPRGYSFQVPFADAMRKQADIATIAVGLILHPQQAEIFWPAATRI